MRIYMYIYRKIMYLYYIHIFIHQHKYAHIYRYTDIFVYTYSAIIRQRFDTNELFHFSLLGHLCTSTSQLKSCLRSQTNYANIVRDDGLFT